MKLEEKIKPKSLEEFYELFQKGEYASFFNYEGLRIYNLISQEGEKTYLRQYELFSGRNLKNTLVEIGKYEILSTDFNKDRINLIFLKDLIDIFSIAPYTVKAIKISFFLIK